MAADSTLNHHPITGFYITATDSGKIRIWHIQGQLIREFSSGHNDLVLSIAFSPDGNRIVSGSRDKTLRLWDKDGSLIGKPYIGHSGSVRSVAFSPKGNRIVSGSADKTIRIWDLQCNPIGDPFVGHTAPITVVTFDRDGHKMISGSEDGTLRIWNSGGWEDDLRYCCNTLMRHVALTLPRDKTARKACEVCEQVWTRQQSAQFAVAQGSALAQRGNVEGAIAKYHRAKDLDPTLTIDPVARANELAEWSGKK